MRDYYNVYARLDTHALKVLRSKKVAAINGLKEVGSFFAKRDMVRLAEQIDAITAELKRREDQPELF